EGRRRADRDAGRAEGLRDGADLHRRRQRNVGAAGDLRQPAVCERRRIARIVDRELNGARSLWPLAAYSAMVLGTVALFLLIRRYGETLTAPPPPASPGSAGSAAAAAAPDALLHVLLALAVVVVLGRLLGRLFARVGQPPVVGEVIAGIL